MRQKRLSVSRSRTYVRCVRRLLSVLSPTSVLLLLSACGGSKTLAASSGAVPTAEPSTAATAPSASPPTETAADDDDDHDPNESAVHIQMSVTFPKKPSYPKATATEDGCWKDVGLTGKHAKDYAAIIDSCGAPTGLVEYAKPVVGWVHHTKDKRDSFEIALEGGLCYRYFAAADGTIADLDILVETTGGALVADDKTKSPVAIIEATKSWCQADDVTYVFHIEVDGPGKGGYTFGVWARKK